MKQGLPAKWLFIPGVIAALFLFFNVAAPFLPNETEYRRDQARLEEVMRDFLPIAPLAEVKLPVKGYIIAGGAGYCMVDAAAGIANFLEPDVNFDKFILYANPTRIMAGRDKNERYGPGLSIMRAFLNLGYTPFRGATTSIHPPQNTVADFEPQNLIYFKSAQEELAFIKKLLSNGIIPIITLTRDPFEPIEGGAFVSMVGYNQDGVWINVSPSSERYALGNKYYLEEPIRYEPRFASYDLLMKFWTNDHQLIWTVKTSPRQTEAEIYAENKKNVQEAAANLQKTIDFLANNGSLLDFTAAIQTPEAAVFYRHFQTQGNLILADQYKELAKIYESFRQSQNPGIVTSDRQKTVAVLTAVRPQISKIATLWP